MRKSEVGVTLVDRSAYRGIYFNSVFLMCFVVLLSFLHVDEFLLMKVTTSLSL